MRFQVAGLMVTCAIASWAQSPISDSPSLSAAASAGSNAAPQPARTPRPRRAGHQGNAGEFLPPDQTKSSGCAMQGVLPDPDCTPGAVMGITVEEVCTTSTKKRRAVTSGMKKQVYKAYGVSHPQPSGAYEVDHFIALELGGSNDIANLWPQPANPTPGFHQKDCVEEYLHDQVCKQKTMSLEDAQRAIAADWLNVFTSSARLSGVGQCKKYDH